MMGPRGKLKMFRRQHGFQGGGLARCSGRCPAQTTVGSWAWDAAEAGSCSASFVIGNKMWGVGVEKAGREGKQGEEGKGPEGGGTGQGPNRPGGP